MNTRASLRRRQRGSAFISVVVFTTVALLLVASLLGWSLTERRLNYRNALRLESRNAAEALAEYGFSQIREKMETRSTINLNPTGTDALVMPPSSFWAGSNVDITKNELIGGTVENVPASGGSYYFNPADPNNEEDPLKGKHVFRRDIQVVAKATVVPSSVLGGPVTSYVSQRISVRGAPLFAHAIFYNMDLEIFNGPPMTISGPVHANGNLYLYPESGALTFTDQVTATGGIYHAKKPGDNSADGNSAVNRSAPINFTNKFGQSQTLRVDNIWKDSTQGNGTSASVWSGFRDFATERWNGNLQTGAHGVNNYTPVAVGKYVEDPTPGGSDDSHNSGRTIIEPTNYPHEDDPDYSLKTEIEYQKYANNAGIYITVNPSTGAITATSRNREDPTKNKVLALPSGLARLKRYKAVSSYTTTRTDRNYIVSTVGTGNRAGQFKYRLQTSTTTTPKTITHTSAGSTETDGDATTSAPTLGSESNWRTTPPGSDSSTSTSTTPSSLSFAADNQGMYDRHRQKGTDLVEIDMDGLRKAVAAMAGQSTATVSTGTVPVAAGDAIGNLTTSDWTGIVYVEVSGGPTTDPITGTTTAATVAASNQTSVRLINGKGKVPSYGTANEGLTIATNAPLYVKGNYNADGTTSTSSPNSATDYETGELPAAIVADAVTILSENFDDSNTLSGSTPTATTSNVEISAALLVGLTPTNKTGTGTTSGGAHNLPKFLENWGTTRNVFIRGSLVALFESRIFTEPHGNGYYGAPARNWGFNKLFREGKYPPGTPRVMSYRRVDFTDLSEAEYNAAKSGFSWPTASP